MFAARNIYTGKDIHFSKKLAGVIINIVEAYGISDYPLGFELESISFDFLKSNKEANEWIQATANSYYSFEAAKQFSGLFENLWYNIPILKP